MEYDRARSKISIPAGCLTGSGEWVEYKLFSQTNSTGTFRTAAKFRLSWKMPSSTAPSPKKATAIRLERSRLKAQAEPTATAIVCPKMADDALTPERTSFKRTD